MNTLNILLVEVGEQSASGVVDAVRACVHKEGRLTICASMTAALEKIREEKPDIIILDLHPPDGSEMETLEIMLKKAANLPLVVLTGVADDEFSAKAVSRGAQDCIFKVNLDPVSLRRSIINSIERNKFRHHFTVRALKGKSEELEAASQELESFTYSVSHDLLAPITAVAQFVRLMEKTCGGGLDKDAKSMLRIIAGNVDLMDELVTGLLDLSRVSSREMVKEELDMKAMAATLSEEFKAKAGPTLQVTIGDLPPASGDYALTSQVWANLISNAVKFSGKKRAPRIDIQGLREKGTCVYSVSDNGAGFSMRQYDRLFGAFQRLHSPSEFQGTGVGLAIVRRVIARHGGQVWAEGRVGKGAVFYFSLPDL